MAKTSVAIIDMFNICHTLWTDDFLSVEVALDKVKTYINNIYQEYKKLYLVYDPITNIDLKNIIANKSFTAKYKKTKKLLEYKSNRIINYNFIEKMRLVFNLFRTDTFKKCISIKGDKIEADDMVSSIIADNPRAIITMYSSDLDWSRFLSKDVCLSINKRTILTYDGFFKKYKFYPSVAAITLWKACFGDESDNILGVAKCIKKLKKIKNHINDFIKLSFEAIKYASNLTCDDVLNIINCSFTELEGIKNKNPIVELMLFIYDMDFNQKICLTTQLALYYKAIMPANNIDYKQYIFGSTNNIENNLINILTHNTNHKGKSIKKAFSFKSIKK